MCSRITYNYHYCHRNARKGVDPFLNSSKKTIHKGFKERAKPTSDSVGNWSACNTKVIKTI